VTSAESLRAVGLAAGLDAVGIAAAEVFESTLADLHSRKDVGLHADMQFTYRNPERSTDPARHLPDARSLVVGARSYHREPGDVGVDGPTGAVARYVWEDHYQQLRDGLHAIAAELDSHGWRSRILIDDNALVDREAAYRAGLGWYGKNANLLLPGRGSWFVLGSVLTDAPLPPAEPLGDGCGSCTRCLTSCPTDAIVEPGVIDANRCLAWLVQAKGQFPIEHRVALGTRIYGCDDCQDVCPPNRREARQPVQITGTARRPWVSLLEILQADDDALLDQYGVWYIPGREPRYLRRNALVALGNSPAAGDPRVEPLLQTILADADADSVVRSHAVWAAKRLGLHHLVGALADDPDDDVRAEVARDVSPIG
jgi:epoxyqueuosine reductase